MKKLLPARRRRPVPTAVFLPILFTSMGSCSANKMHQDEDRMEDQQARAEVVSVRVEGGAGAYSFSIGIQSPDTGCAQ